MIKNYTSSVPVDRTIMRIEVALINGGAVVIGMAVVIFAMFYVCWRWEKE